MYPTDSTDFVLPAGINYQFHFVDGYKYPPHKPEMDITTYSELVMDNIRDFDNGKFDEFAHNRVTMWVSNLNYYIEMLNEDKISYIKRVNAEQTLFSLIIDTTAFAGNVVELISDAGFDDEVGMKVWTEDLCSSV